MSEQTISKSAAIAAYDGNASELARALGISPQAVYQWDEDAIPETHALKLRFVLKPDVFGPAPARADKRRKAA